MSQHCILPNKRIQNKIKELQGYREFRHVFRIFWFWWNSASAFHSTVQRPPIVAGPFFWPFSTVFVQIVPGYGWDWGRGPGTVTGKDSQAFFNSSLLCATLPNGSSGALGLYLSCVQLLLLLAVAATENWFPGESWLRRRRHHSDSTVCPILSTLDALLFPETS